MGVANGGGGDGNSTAALFFLFLFSSFPPSLSQPRSSFPARQSLEISIGIGVGVGIGGGGAGGGSGGGSGGGECGCVPVAPSPLPSPLFQELIEAEKVIERLKSFVEDDPNGITKTWVGSNPCKYQGFFCASPPRNTAITTVSTVDFNRYNIMFKSGALETLSCLKDLAIFHANTNRFKGTIPSALAKLRYLYELDLSNNLLSGEFPALPESIPQLLFFDIRFNKFSGQVPASIFQANLDVLFLNNDAFCGPLPDALGSSPVSALSLANNKFTGNIPATIKNMSQTLIQVLFLNNELSGCLPPEIGYLKKATVFDVGRNRLSGPIPLSFGCLQGVEQLNLAGNFLYGEIPDAVCELPNLKNLSLSGNFFTWEGPACRRLAESGVLNDNWNCISDRPNQRSPEECEEFKRLPKSCPLSPFDCVAKLPCILPPALLRPNDRIIT